MNTNISDKLETLADSAKYDVACTSSGASGSSNGQGIGNKTLGGICHSFAADGRCITLLKVLMTNICINDCKYCINRRSNDSIKRAAFTPRELADLTIEFYKRNYIEGLFLSSGIVKNADYTCELMMETLLILRNEYKFYGYIHVKSIPGADPLLIDKLGRLADRISINIELPSQNSLATLAPEKNKDLILKPMGYIAGQIRGNGYKSIENSKFKSLPQKVSKSSTSLIAYKNGKSGVFAPAGQSTQMIIGASPETDLHILRLSENLYKKYELKRVFFSAYIPISDNPLLPSVDTKPPLLREHRLYQADFLMRFYKFQADEILNERNPNFNPFVDPKCNWALNHPEFFPIDINTASYEELLRAPGIGVLSAKKIIAARRFHSLDFSDLKKFSVVLKRAKYFIVCSGKKADGVKTDKASIMQSLMSKNEMNRYKGYFPMPQLELFQQNTSLPPLSL